MRIYDPNLPLVALHIPKTGGTSILQVLQVWFPDGRLHLHYKTGDVLPARHALAANCCVYGHFNGARGFGVEDYYPDAQQFMAFFREPFDRFLSQWFFLAKLRRAGQAAAAPADDTGFGNWIAKRAEEQRCGLNSFSFVWQMPRRPGTEPVDAMLRERFMFVGTMERCAESIQCLATILQRPPQSMPHLNATPREGGELSHWRPYFEKHFADEMELYEQARALNARMIDAMKGAAQWK